MTDPVTPAAPAPQDTPPAASTEPTTTPAAAPTEPAATAPAAAPVAAAPTDDWRIKYAEGDEKLLKRLERYTSPKAAFEALVQAQNKISAGEVKKPLGPDATPEQVAAWRAENGIPDKPDGYLQNLPQGVVLGEEDKAIFSSFAERMHAKNVSPEVMHEVVGWYNQFKDQQASEFAERESASLEATHEALRQEWGNDFKVNLNAAKSLLASAPEGVSERLQTVRMPDGTPLLNDPQVMRWLAQTAREINPIATLVPNTTNPGLGIEGEIAQIENTMRTNRRAYDADNRLQARYRDLLTARDKLAKAS